MNEFIKQYGLYLLYFVGIIIVGIAMTIYNIKRMKKQNANYLSENPDAAKVFLTHKFLITTEAVSVLLVNNESPCLFTEKGKSGFYLKGGENEVQISYSYSRPGVMYKTVTKSTGAIDKTLEVEPNKSYSLSYDRKIEEFIFEELDEKR